MCSWFAENILPSFPFSRVGFEYGNMPFRHNLLIDAGTGDSVHWEQIGGNMSSPKNDKQRIYDETKGNPSPQYVSRADV